MIRMVPRRRRLALLGALILALAAGAAAARPLADIEARGVLTLCAHPNALPHAARDGQSRGVQIELAEELARRLGVALDVGWVTASIHYRRVDCDIVMDAILEPAALADRRIRPSIPYQRSGVALALPPGSAPLAHFVDLGPERKIGVQVGSLAQTVLGRAGLRTSPFVFEDEMLAGLAAGEIEAAAASPASIGWYNLRHPDRPLVMVEAYEQEPELAWQLVVGMRRSDQTTRAAVDRALQAMLDDGTIAAVYARYGLSHRPPVRPGG